MAVRFSIIIPLYNKAQYIQTALESVFAQTYKEWECIVVDDGSTDNSLDAARAFNDGRLKILSQAHAGVAAARNKGVKASNNEYICFLDADDWWEPTYLQEMAQLIGAFPDAGLYATNYIYFKPGKTHVALHLPTGLINYPAAYLQSEAMPVWTGASCLPRSVFDEMGGFLEEVCLGEDFLLWAKIALHKPVAFGEKPLAFYNNAVPATMRATLYLHEPSQHMLFQLAPLELEIAALEPAQQSIWHDLLDKLRVYGLMDYWLNKAYHEAAAIELAKVDWSRQTAKTIRLYKLPIGLLKGMRRMKQIGSVCKQIVFLRKKSE